MEFPEIRGRTAWAARQACIKHMGHQHHIPREKARKQLVEIGAARPGVVIDDQLIAQWNAMVDAGVIE
jgi:uncharacterized protein YyaL (SSP411 family)